METKFLSGDWGPAELDGGKLCEAVSRCLLQLDTGRVTDKDLPGPIEAILLNQNIGQAHNLLLKDRQHITKVISMVYKLRNDRGIAHISPIHSANGMDAMLILHACKWIFAEFLRLAWNGNRQVVGQVIDQLVQLRHSIIHELDGKPLVQVPGISAHEEVLLLLNHAASHRLSRSEIREYASLQKPDTLKAAISRLISEKDVRQTDDKAIALTPKGEKRVREVVMPKRAAQM